MAVIEQKVDIILGPPGTGKTTALIDRVVRAVRGGVTPERIAYIAFTNAAADVAAERAVTALGLKIPPGRGSQAVLPGIRTLHSLCYRELEARGAVMLPKDWIDFVKVCGEPMTATGVKQFFMRSKKAGDRMHAADEYARTTCKPLEEGRRRFNGGLIDEPRQVRFSNMLRKFKEARAKMDFTDMLLAVPANCEPLDLDLAIIDEAQDLTMAQWLAALHLFKRTPSLVVAGDDDQAIFEWAGAAVDFFQKLPGERVVLPKSYRLGAEVKAFSDKIAGRIRHRIPKQWEPSGEKSEVIRKPLQFIIRDIARDDETWLFICRNMYRLEPVVLLLYHKHLLFNGASFPDELNAIDAWESLRTIDRAPGHNIIAMLKYLRKDLGASGGSQIGEHTFESLGIDAVTARKIPWWVALEIPDRRAEYYRDCFKSGETRQRVTINTIHGVKGLEADNVVLLLDWSRAVHDNYVHDPDSEHRVMYVAATRARKRLFLPPRETLKGYMI